MPDSASLVDRPCLTRQQFVSRRTGREQTRHAVPQYGCGLPGPACVGHSAANTRFFENKLAEKEIRQLLLFASGQIDCKGRG
jgi:hypothetical protein